MRLAELLCATPKLAPQRPLPSIGQLPQLVLVPTDQRRYQQAGEAEIVVRLHRELHRREQVLHGEWLVEVQAVDPGDRHAASEQPRDDQRGKLAAASDQHEDVAWRQRPSGRSEHRALRQHFLNARGEVLGIMAVAKLDPAFLALVGIVVEFRDRKGQPQLDLPGPVAVKGPMRLRLVRQCECGKA